MPSYGRGFSVPSSESNDIGSFPTFDASQTPAGDEDTSTTREQTKLIDGLILLTYTYDVASSANSGLFDFSALITQGYLTATGDAASGVTYDFDDCSQTVCCQFFDSNITYLTIFCIALYLQAKYKRYDLLRRRQELRYVSHELYLTDYVGLSNFVASKGSYIKDQSLGGFAMWHVLGDSNDILLDSIHTAVQ